MITISLCMIVRDEEKLIGRCLDSVKDIVDEIIVVDTGSKDSTKEIVKQYTSLIYDFKWIDDFSAARNYSFSKATKEYILWLDADDIILEEDRNKFLNLKQNLSNEIDIVAMRYNLYAKGNPDVVCTFPRERLLKRSLGFVWHDPVHEYLILKGKIINADINISHKSEHGRSTRNLMIFENIVKSGRELSDRQYFYYARELFLNERYEEAIVYYKKFLDTEGGIKSNYLDACLDISYCYQTKNDSKNKVKALLRFFEYCSPRAEICCRLGSHYKDLENFEQAIAWYRIALMLEKPKDNTTSVIHDFWGYIPCMELCYCYYKIGDFEKAEKFNSSAGQYKPNSSSFLNNKKLLDEMLHK